MIINNKFLIAHTNLEKKIDFHLIFGNNFPITLEIGSGKGEFIATYSRFYPDRNFIGLETKDKRIVSICKKLDSDKNKNVRIFKLFVDKDIINYFEPSTIDEIIIFHPDPWPKTRHHKHRLFQPQFIDALHYLLRPFGWIRISTDDENYAKWIINLFQKRDDFECAYLDGYTMIPPEDHLITYFDILKSQEGFEPRFMKYRRIK